MKPQRVQEFKEMYREHFGIELTDAEALEQLQSLLAIVRLTFQPMSQEQYERLQQRRRQTGDLENH